MNKEKLLTSKEVWAIGGGKGGVGKSLTSANLAICLAIMGHKVIAIDLDLGGANLHTCLGVSIPALTLSDFISKKVKNFADLLVDTPLNNLKLISGAQDELAVANLKHMQKSKLLKHLHDLEADIILFDLGAGTTFNTIDFFISADKGILVTLPEPTAIENTYRFIKSVFQRKIKSVEGAIEVAPLIDKMMNTKIGGHQTSPVEMIKKIKEINPTIANRMEDDLKSFHPALIINQVRDQGDVDIGYSMQTVCRKYFGFEMNYAGYITHNEDVLSAVKKRKPLLLEFPHSNLVSHFDSIVHNLIKSSL